ncbi:hypothetical protein L195_g008764 [Trifolium pratense]|uniref:Uncharacterized protein n=1 Tax=Trifolium pratense TaxID=57577 RepID=A0A2K3PA29_TRIPR|nr:hypothetical protein L195_g008764 [Trifolium pratense]
MGPTNSIRYYIIRDGLRAQHMRHKHKRYGSNSTPLLHRRCAPPTLTEPLDSSQWPPSSQCHLLQAGTGGYNRL